MTTMDMQWQPASVHFSITPWWKGAHTEIGNHVVGNTVHSMEISYRMDAAHGWRDGDEVQSCISTDVRL
jgi:hypothetical protein